jgi:uncharacterized membrane protein YedE/YeeE
MAITPSEDNPYPSPEAPDKSADLPRRRTRLLIISVSLLYLYGAVVVLYSVTVLYMLFGGCSLSNGRTRASDAQIMVVMVGMAILGVHGCFAIATGGYIWKRRWRRSAIAFAGAVVLAFLVGATVIITNRLPPGKPLPYQAPAGQTQVP